MLNDAAIAQHYNRRRKCFAVLACLEIDVDAQNRAELSLPV
jgi:hypothetical protein